MKTYIILDESGAMHLKNERYFIIGGYITTDLQKIKSLHKNTEKIVKQNMKIDLNEKKEFKGSNLSSKNQSLFINSLFDSVDSIPVAIIIDKYNLKEFNASENIAYNFFVKSLLVYLLKCQIPELNTKEINLRMDKRSIAVKGLRDLEAYLHLEFEAVGFDFNVEYLDSKDNPDIQMADYVSNLLWKKYNRASTEKLSRKIKKINRIYKSKFPFKTFGNNPSLKEENEKS